MVLNATCNSRKRAGRCNKKCEAADQRGDHAGAAMAGAFKKALHGQRAVAADEVIELPDDLAADGVGAEHQARDRDGDQQDRRNREQRVVGERRAHPRAVIVPPRAARASDGSQDRRFAHGLQCASRPGLPLFNSEPFRPSPIALQFTSGI
jgi:hypothetical protein